ncbi:histidine kinase [Sphingobacterium sp. DR205]|uniref:sensor histidine kinase n=1 Tax=Sphingobacterium sp. DR205 TaxID=2713573 RepID=UPI0013E41469|nr:histidine kinase [Sphingobacterium sp. DR205]QIH35936.1 hypothetical protein G6053_25015 [Sphingobacterium sp. DR205]
MKSRNHKLFRIYGFPSFGLFLYLILVLLNPLERTFVSWESYGPFDYLIEFMLCTFYAMVICETGIQLNQWMSLFYSWDHHIYSRFPLQLLLHSFVLYCLIRIFFLFDFPVYFGYDTLLHRQLIIIGVIMSLLSTTVFAAEHYFYNWTAANTRSIELERYTNQAQLEALKLQLDPHFLFNNLSTVTALIDQQPATATAYVTKLAAIYRYILGNRDRDTIFLYEEMEFINNYLFLYETRYGESIQVNIEENKTMLRAEIPPLTLQLLIENAIKHNIFSKEDPLFINIYYHEPNTMVIENNKWLKAEGRAGTKLGLKNIKERYRLLGCPLPEIVENDEIFRVEIPLIITKNS